MEPVINRRMVEKCVKPGSLGRGLTRPRSGSRLLLEAFMIGAGAKRDRSMYVKSLAVAIQALSIIAVGPIADSRGCHPALLFAPNLTSRPAYWRKRLLLTFAYLGSSSAILFFFFPASLHSFNLLLAALLTIVGSTGHATSIVCANAFLPELAQEEEQSMAISKTLDTEDCTADLEVEAQPLLPSTLILEAPPISPYDRKSSSGGPTSLSLITSRLSSTAIAIGFLSGVSVLAVLLIPITILHGSIASLRLAIGFCGVWWAVFTVPAWLGLPGGSIEEDDSETRAKRLSRTWLRVRRMVRWEEMKALPNLYTFLLAWVFLSDGAFTYKHLFL